jgi:glycolate dehydrogenase FAD-linked subunit
MLDLLIIQKLKEIVGAEQVATDRQDLICYGYDATQMEFLPDAVVHPGSPEEVSAVLRLANEENFPVFPRGAGSGFTGGALPKGGGVVLVVTRLNKILRIDTENLIAEVEPGVVTEQLQIAVEKLGLFYPPDPASLKFRRAPLREVRSHQRLCHGAGGGAADRRDHPDRRGDLQGCGRL